MRNVLLCYQFNATGALACALMRRQTMLAPMLLSLLVPAVAAGFGSDVHAQENAQLEVQIQRTETMSKENKNAYKLATSGFVRATPELVWKILTDYQRLPEFVPNLLLTKVVSRSGKDTVLEQHGRAGFLFIKRDIRMMVRATEQAISNIDITLISGDMKHYEAHWKMTPTEKNGVAGTQIDYSATMEPDFFVPPMIGASMIQQDVKKMTAAVMAEIARRAAE